MHPRRFDRDDLAWVAVRGADRQRFLHAMLCSAVQGLEDGSGHRSLLLSKKGRVLADCVLLSCEAEILLGCDLRAREALIAGLEHHLVADDVDLFPLTLRSVHLLGGGAKAFLEAELGCAMPVSPFAHGAFGPLRAVHLPLGEVPGVLLLGPASGEGFEPIDALSPGEAVDLDRLRVAAGEPAWGLESGPEFFPQEVGLAHCLHRGKGCYLGQETMVRIETRGQARWTLVSLRLEGGLASAGDEVLEAGEDGEARAVGRVTSAALVPGELLPGSGGDRLLALARLRPDASAPGTRFTIAATARDGDGTAFTHEIAATVIARPS